MLIDVHAHLNDKTLITRIEENNSRCKKLWY